MWFVGVVSELSADDREGMGTDAQMSLAGSHDALARSHDMLEGSHDPLAGSHDAVTQ